MIPLDEVNIIIGLTDWFPAERFTAGLNIMWLRRQFGSSFMVPASIFGIIAGRKLIDCPMGKIKNIEEAVHYLSTGEMPDGS